jgi:hypothetical protein
VGASDKILIDYRKSQVAHCRKQGDISAHPYYPPALIALVVSMGVQLQMKTTNKFIINNWPVWRWIFLFGSILISISQNDPLRAQSNDEITDKDGKIYNVRVDVNEVRFDVVVLDKNGHQITDLTAKDFELFHDNQPMEIRSCTYIADQANRSDRPTIFPY